jgi:type I restriction enzyme S subunit
VTAVPLKRIALVVAGQSPASDEVSEFRGEGLPFLQGNAEFGSASPKPVKRCDTASRQVRVGDLLLSIRAPVGALNVADREYGIGRGLAAIRARPSRVTDRYLWWALHQLLPTLASFAVGSTYDAVTRDDIGALSVPLPSRAHQHAIADFLDHETARIDSLIAARRKMLGLIAAREATIVETSIWPATGVGQLTPLKALTPIRRPIMYGIVLPGPDVADGILLVKGGDVEANRLSPSLLARTARAIEAPYARSRLRAEDVVFAIRGSVGAAAAVPAAIEGANITQDVARVSPGPAVAARWLLHAMRSASFRAQAEARTTGATIRGLNIWDLKRCQLPVPTVARQLAVAAHLDNVCGHSERHRAMMRQQIELLHERRQALITAAVTGQLDIPGTAA